MIGFNILGRMGRLGNQMFQCAALVGIAEYRGFDYCIPDHSEYRMYGRRRYHELQGCFKMSGFEGRYGYVDGKVVHLEQHHFSQELLENCPDNSTLVGYFESEKYFRHVEDKIRHNYQFKDFIVEKCLAYGRDILKNHPVGIVVRRGDFLFPHHRKRHPVCKTSYYKKALKKFEGRDLLLFSDDISWCRKQRVFKKNKNVFFVESSEGIYKGHFDLCLLSMCHDFVIANSTFAWWGAWLSVNKNKKVIAPSRWFGPELKHYILTDQLPESWERL